MSFTLPTKRPLIMGIINVTPDSFSGDGVMTQTDFVASAVQQAKNMVEEGADILDIGGESSRPGSTPISAEEEIRRVVPVIAAIRKTLKTPISIDTIKATVAEAALNAGADIINDISALRGDEKMAALAAARQCQVILMHNRSCAEAVASDTKLGNEYQAAVYGNFIEDIKRELAEAAETAIKAGITRDKIILDPGIGFGKTVEQNLALVGQVATIKSLGFPVMLGPSRKSFIGKALNKPVSDRLEGTAALVAIAAFLGTDIIRVHDVGIMSQVAALAAQTAKN